MTCLGWGPTLLGEGGALSQGEGSRKKQVDSPPSPHRPLSKSFPGMEIDGGLGAEKKKVLVGS